MPARIAESIMGKQLDEFLRQKKAALVKKWFVRLLETYPPETGKLWFTQKDPFTNPVGATFHEGLEELFDGLLAGKGGQDLARALDSMIHIRAIQGFPPSGAIGFVSLLKEIVREELAEEGGAPVSPEDLRKFDSRIDQLSLTAFELYTQCRKKIHEIQLRELKSRTMPAMEARGGCLLEKSDP
jgi:hypothetical protein